MNKEDIERIENGTAILDEVKFYAEYLTEQVWLSSDYKSMFYVSYNKLKDICEMYGLNVKDYISDEVFNQLNNAKPICFHPNNDTYPLCKGQKSSTNRTRILCEVCNLYEGMKEGEY